MSRPNQHKDGVASSANGKSAAKAAHSKKVAAQATITGKRFFRALPTSATVPACHLEDSEIHTVNFTSAGTARPPESIRSCWHAQLSDCGAQAV